MLDQKDLGQCYKFYDPILSIIEEMCSDHKKNLFIQRNVQLLRMSHEDMNIMSKIAKKFKSNKKKEEDVENDISFDNLMTMKE